MRFLADMGISMRTVAWLRQIGHDVIHLREQGWHRMADDAILEKACADRRAVLTMDLDFGYLLAVSGGKLPSVILFRLSDESSGVVNERLSEVLAQCQGALDAGAIVSVSDASIRVRRLPI
jgi:predicted nuclease of predicted toxin-antitoxin system